MGDWSCFYIGPDAKLYHNWQIRPNSLFRSGPSQFSVGEAIDLAVGRNIDGRLEMFYVGTNSHSLSQLANCAR